MAASTDPGPSVRRSTRGAFGDSIEAARFVDAPSPIDIGEDGDGLRRCDVAILASRGASFRVRGKCKALRAERLEKCVISVPFGCVASLELLRCKGVVVELGAPVACIRVDDSEKVQIAARWPARVGYPDDSRAGSAPGMGLRVYSAGSHHVTINFPAHDGDDAPLREHLLPEVIVTQLSAEEQDAPRSSILKPGEWR
jgi:hypothetical protein